MSDDDAAAKIAADGIDILIDVNGYTRDARTAVFAGGQHPSRSTGMASPAPWERLIIITSSRTPTWCRMGQEIFFSEKVMRLPCYQPNDRKRSIAPEAPSRAEEGLPEKGFVFCCLNGTQKITPQLFGAWMQILAAVEHSVLWLLDSSEEANERLRQMAAAAGIAPRRICFAPKRPNPQHLARYRLADLFLDTFPYGAHTTASDAMWMGTPVLTLEGSGFAARVCAGLVRSAGMPDLVCQSLDEYIARAIAVAGSPDIAAALRARLEQNRATCALFDTTRLVRGLEALFEHMWEDFSSGQLPVPNLTNLGSYEEIGLDLLAGQEGESIPPENYRAELARWNEAEPLPHDGRLWPPEPHATAGVLAFTRAA